mgnify:CR=1 FL=1
MGKASWKGWCLRWAIEEEYKLARWRKEERWPRKRAVFKPKSAPLVGAHHKQFGNPRLECKLQKRKRLGQFWKGFICHLKESGLYLIWNKEPGEKRVLWRWMMWAGVHRRVDLFYGMRFTLKILSTGSVRYTHIRLYIYVYIYIYLRES